MIMFRRLTEPYDWDWFAKRTHTIACADSQGIVAYDKKGVVHGVCVLDSFTVDACSVHLAIDNPFVIRHGFLNEIALHAFITCGRKRLFGLVPSTNEKARKLDEHIGMRLDKADCRWLPQELREAA